MGKTDHEIKNYFRRIERLKESILTLNFTDIPLELKKFPYDEIFERIPIPIFAISKNFTFTYINNKIFEVSRYLAKDLLDKPFYTLFDKENIPVVEENLNKIIYENLPKVRFTATLTRRDGTKTPALALISSVMIDGKIAEAVGTLIDISDVAKDDTDSFIETFFIYSDSAVIEIDYDGKILNVFGKLENIFKLDNSYAGKNILELSEDIYDISMRMRNEGIERILEHRIYLDGKSKNSPITVNLHSEKNKKSIYIFVRKFSQKATHDEAYRDACFKLFTDISDSYYFSVDADFVVKYAGHGLRRISENIFGNPLEIGNIFSLMLNGNPGKDIWIKSVQRALNGEKVAVDLDLNIEEKESEYRVYFSPIISDNEIIGAVIVLTNIAVKPETRKNALNYMEELESSKFLLEQKANELAKLNVKLLESESALKQSNQNKDKFFSIISHDLRNPLHALLSATELLSEEIETLEKEEVTLFANSINKSAKNMFSLIENLLQWSRIQLGKLKPVFSKVNLYETTSQNFNYLMGAAQVKNIKLINELEKKLYALADPNMLNSIIQNIISNAIKFTNPEGEVKVSAKTSGKDIIIAVSDNGIGMEKEDLDNLFRLQNLSSKHGTANEKGTGLGLIICKELAEINKGEIWAESEAGKGSVFYVKLNKYPEPI